MVMECEGPINKDQGGPPLYPSAMEPDSDKTAPIDITSHDLDLVSLYRSQGTDARMHADIIHGILESNGVYSIVSGIVYPPVACEVKVARGDLQKAQKLVEEARASGQKAAEEGEAASEKEQY
jgi:hypothetical protein